jgi:hypothetical protein
MTQVPAWLKVTVAPEIEHTEGLDGSMVIVTGSFDVAVAVTS